MKRSLTSMVVVAAFGTLMGCAGDGNSSDPTGPSTTAAPSATEPGQPVVITISASRFSTPEVRVPVGTTVVWDNADPFAHTITSTDAAPTAFDSGELGDGTRFEFTFDQPGEYPYFCEIHPTMRAVVVVE